MKTIKLIIFLCFSTTRGLQVSEVTKIDFIKSYIENEGKPTHLLCCNLCWKKNLKLTLAKTMSNAGIRISKTMEHKTKYQDHGLLFFLDLNCPGVERIILSATARQLFRFPYRWLVLYNSASTKNSTSTNMNTLMEAPILLDNDLVLAEKTNAGYKLFELHKISVNHSVIFTSRGFYNGSLVDTRTERGLFHRRNNMMGHPMSMSAVISDSNSTMYHLPREDRLDSKNDAIAKVSWMSARLAFEMLNATPEYTFSFRYGFKLNGTWSGMIADLIDEKADTGTNILFFSERLDVIDYTDAVAPITLEFIFRQPPLSYDANIFSLPFSTNVWLAIAGSAALFIYLIWLSAMWETRHGAGPTQVATMGDSMLLTAAAVAQQGCSLEPRKASGRIMLWVYFTALMALYAAFSANIVVLLQSPSNSIRTLEHLAKSKIALGAIEADYSHFLFKLFDDPARVEILRRIENEDSKEEPHFYSLEDGIERVRKGLFAFFSISDPMYYQISNTFTELEKCDLMTIEFFKGLPQYIPVKKNSPYLELMRITIKRLREAGINKVLKSRIYPMKPSCPNKATVFTSVGMQDFKPAMILLLYGNLVAVGIALAEIIVVKMKNRDIGIIKILK